VAAFTSREQAMRDASRIGAGMIVVGGSSTDGTRRVFVGGFDPAVGT
jgi:hypothetical protein